MINETRIKEIKRTAKERFAEYTSHYDMSQPKISLKAKHTYRVADFCEEIARSLDLQEDEILVAWLCGMLHDIGRFEQVVRFNTFYDSISVDHAHLSCEILWGTDSLAEEDRCPGGLVEPGIIREFIAEDEYDEIIRTAIWWHSAYRYPAEFSERQRMFCDILRDADKIDIFRVNTETPLSDIHNVPMQDFYTSEVTKEVMDAFMEHHCVLRALKKTAVDNIVGYASLYWELVYPESRNMTRTQGYLKQIVDFKTQNPNAQKAFEKIREELRL